MKDIDPPLSWEVPEPRHNLWFFDHIVSRTTTTGDDRERLENYLGRLNPIQRLELYRRIAAGKKTPQDFEEILYNIERERLLAGCKAVMVLDKANIKPGMTMLGEIHSRIRRLLTSVEMALIS